jgi:hypothetical protein
LRATSFLAILAGAFVATPFVVMAAGGPSPAPVADLAPQAPPPALVAAAAPTPAERQPAACGRKVRVVYPGSRRPRRPAAAA